MDMMQKTPLVIANWKNALSVVESVRLAHAIRRDGFDGVHAEVVLAPSYVALQAVVEAIGDAPLGVAVQSVGAHAVCTGEINPHHAVAAGATYAILGHSERRAQLGETDEDVMHQVSATVRAGLIPVVCVGETKTERRAGKTKTVLKRQLSKALAAYKGNSALVIAYEPVWAVGAKKPATMAMIREAHTLIRGILTHGARVIYGGSVDAQTAALLGAEPLVDGCLVGRASLDETSFRAIIEAYTR